MQRNLLLVLLSCLLIQSCGLFRGKDGADGLSAARSASRIVRDLDKNAFRPQYLEGSGRIKLESKDLNIGGTATVRLERDAAIWVSVRKFGLEGARALIRPDSFFVYNRLQGEYTAEPLDYIEEKYNIPARFDLLQEMILGNAVFLTRDLDLATDGDRYTLNGGDTRYTTEYLVNGRGLLLERMDVREANGDREISILNGDFKIPDGAERKFPHDRTLRISSAASGPAAVFLTFNRVKLEGPLEMPFRRR